MYKQYYIENEKQRPFGHMTESLKQLILDSISISNKNKLVMLEIGSYEGDSAEIFLNTGYIEKIYCIDPWNNFIDHSDNAIHYNMQKRMKKFDLRFQNDNRVFKIVGTIDTFIKKYKDHMPIIDIVYIDGNHEFVYVKNDILKTLNIIKPTIAISGHDYDLVYLAVKKYIGNISKLYDDKSWIKFFNYENTN